MKIRIINGPNLGLLGTREPEIYGKISLREIEEKVSAAATELDVDVDFQQFEGEGEIVRSIHDAREFNGIIINPGGYTHYSVAIADALRLVSGLVVEVHISNIYAREDYRRVSVTATAAWGVVAGMGIEGYCAALRALVGELRARGS